MTTWDDVPEAEIEAFNAEAEARYRRMTGMDLPLEERAARMRENAAKTPLSYRTWREVREQVYGPRTVTEFLLARIADLQDGRISYGVYELARGEFGEPRDPIVPPRVLAECEAKRLTVRFLSDLERGEFGDTMTASIAHSVLCRMAAPHADHPDYQEEWKP